MTSSQIEEIVRRCMKEENEPLKNDIENIKVALLGNEKWDIKGLITEVKDLSSFKKTVLRKAYQAGGFMAAFILIVRWAWGALLDMLHAIPFNN